MSFDFIRMNAIAAKASNVITLALATCYAPNHDYCQTEHCVGCQARRQTYTNEGDGSYDITRHSVEGNCWVIAARSLLGFNKCERCTRDDHVTADCSYLKCDVCVEYKHECCCETCGECGKIYADLEEAEECCICEPHDRIIGKCFMCAEAAELERADQ